MKSKIIISFIIFSVLKTSAFETIIYSDQSQKSCNIWIEKGESILFSVRGRWTMWDRWKPVDYRGHVSFEKTGNYFLGTLIGRVEGGKDFAIEDGMEYVSPVSGLLFIFPNRVGYTGLKTSGMMEVGINGGKSVTPAEAEKLYGWDPDVCDTARSRPDLSENEKDVILFINKVRLNPQLFARIYLANMKDCGADALDCYNELLSAQVVAVLKPSKALITAAGNHAHYMGENGLTGHQGPDEPPLHERVAKYGRYTGKYDGPWENCSYGFQNPLDIVLQLLIDDGVKGHGHRKNILNKNAGYIGVSTARHRIYNFNCVMNFADSIEDF
jgi:uncharacterized protein YkwD